MRQRRVVALIALAGTGLTLALASATPPANAGTAPHHTKTFNCKVNHVDIFKVWTSAPGGPIAWHRKATAEITCETRPNRNCARLAIQQFKKVEGIKQWVTVGRGKPNCQIPRPTKDYSLYMKCSLGRYRTELKVTGESSSGVVNHGVIFHSKRVLRIANCSKPPGFPVQPQVSTMALHRDTPDGYPDPVGSVPDISPRPMCEASGNHFCARIENNSSVAGARIVLGNNTPGPAENTHWNPNGGTFTWNNHTYSTGTLGLPGHPGLCYGLDTVSPDNVVTVSCSTGNGRILGRGASNDHDVWIFRGRTQALLSLQVLAASDTQFFSLFSASWFDTAPFKKWEF